MGNGSKDKDGESSQPLVGSSKGDVEAGEDGITSDKCQKKKTCGSKCLACFRCVFGFVMFPFVFLITLLTAFLWIILLPGTHISLTFSFRPRAQNHLLAVIMRACLCWRQSHCICLYMFWWKFYSCPTDKKKKSVVIVNIVRIFILAFVNIFAIFTAWSIPSLTNLYSLLLLS